MTDVDNSWKNIKSLEQKIADCSRQVTSLPQEIKEVQGNVDRLLQNGPKISEAAAKIANLDNILTETERRIESLQSVNTGLKKTQLDVQTLNREVNIKLDAIHKITTAEVAKNQPSKDTGISPSERETIRSLKRSGWTIQEIASRTKRTPTEIELLLDLPED